MSSLKRRVAPSLKAMCTLCYGMSMECEKCKPRFSGIAGTFYAFVCKEYEAIRNNESTQSKLKALLLYLDIVLEEFDSAKSHQGNENFLSSVYCMQSRLLFHLEAPKSLATLRACKMSLKFNPLNLVSLNMYAILTSREHGFKKAITIIRKALRLDPTNPYLLYNIGIYYVQLGHLKKGLEYFSSALKDRRVSSRLMESIYLNQASAIKQLRKKRKSNADANLNMMNPIDKDLWPYIAKGTQTGIQLVH